MSNKIKILSLCVALVGAGFTMGFAGVGTAQAALQKSPEAGIASQKRCEKCKRGPDGKMECTPVPCPK